MRLFKLFLSSFLIILTACKTEKTVRIQQSEGVHVHVFNSRIAVLLVGGSGSVDDNYLVDGIPLYQCMADALAQNGISSLRLKKRLDYKTIDEEYLEDIQSALDVLKKQYDDVYLLGHSLGAAVSVVFDDQVDGLILMGGFVSEVEEVYALQLKKNASDEQKLVIDEELNTILNLVDDSGFSWFGLPESWWISMDKLALRERLKALKSPVLVLFSAQDEQVALEEYKLYQSVLSSHKHAEFVLVEDVNHFFVDASSQQMSESVIQQIASWILKQSSVIIKKRCCE